jgi:hypothetical protein
MNEILMAFSVACILTGFCGIIAKDKQSGREIGYLCVAVGAPIGCLLPWPHFPPATFYILYAAVVVMFSNAVIHLFSASTGKKIIGVVILLSTVVTAVALWLK